jgi:hypothetical protein
LNYRWGGRFSSHFRRTVLGDMIGTLEAHFVLEIFELPSVERG